MSCDLSSTGIVVTRASHQAEPLCNLIKAHGGHVVHFPVLEIQPLKPVTFTASINDCDTIIFISPNAVRCGLAALGNLSQLHDKTVAAVGKATARTLEAEGMAVDILPQGSADSETLLKEPQLQQVKGQNIVIVRGEGGRPLLGDTLAERGANLSYAEVYRRICPTTDNSALLKAWDKIDVITSTSIDMLNNLVTLLGKEAYPQLRHTPLLVISTRMQKQAKVLGFQRIILADGASDSAILTALCRWKQE